MVLGDGKVKEEGFVNWSGRPVGENCGRGAPPGRGAPFGIVIWIGGMAGGFRYCIIAIRPAIDRETATSVPTILYIGLAPGTSRRSHLLKV
jgi:hypothetical protein